MRAKRPGILIRAELEARGWMQKDLARILGRPEQMVSEISRGRKLITPETALELEAAIGWTAEYWMHVCAAFRLRLAREEHAEAIEAVRRRASREPRR